jgi:BirA family biotin operon repressor/biotin-[acetyl-CoA-carboxylase] ligase
VTERIAFDQIPSTQEHARAQVRLGVAPGTYYVAAEQTAGRGRLDHPWSSPPGGLYVSLVGPEFSAAGPALSVLVGGVVVDLVRSRWRVPAHLKWPNDIVVAGPNHWQKVGGVLLDRVEGSQGIRSVIGIGLNVVGDPSLFPAEFSRRVAFLSDFVTPAPTLPVVEEAVVERILSSFAGWTDPAFVARALGATRALLFGRGRPVLVDGIPMGRIKDLGDDGSLMLDTPSGVRSVLAGQIEVEAAP